MLEITSSPADQKAWLSNSGKCWCCATVIEKGNKTQRETDRKAELFSEDSVLSRQSRFGAKINNQCTTGINKIQLPRTHCYHIRLIFVRSGVEYRRAPSCVYFACSPRVCMDFLRVLQHYKNTHGRLSEPSKLSFVVTECEWLFIHVCPTTGWKQLA